MTRTTDDLNPPEPFRGLGEKVERKTPAPSKPKPEGPSGLVTGPDGRIRTTTHPRD